MTRPLDHEMDLDWPKKQATTLRSQWHQWKHQFRSWRRNQKSRLPWVRRRLYDKLVDKHDQFIQTLSRLQLSPASAATLTQAWPLKALGKELCLFVTHATHPIIKHHVKCHVASFKKQGFDVVLIVNTDLPHGDIVIDDVLRDLCAGIMIRENKGFDFGAWAHVAQLIGSTRQFHRITVTNDSVLGPLSEMDFERLITHIRASLSDMIGLTQNLYPIPHLQSFFLTFQNHLLQGRLDRLFESVLIN